MAPSSTIECTDLTFELGGKVILKNLNLALPTASRTLLVGANGAGKSTLLRLLAGKRLVKDGACRVDGKRAFFEPVPGLTYLGTEWATNPVVRGDIAVSQLLQSAGVDKHRERAKELLEVMDVNPLWHMNAVSDGERRRVQIVMGLLAPWSVLLLDEVTVDLDAVVRSDLLAWLKAETERRGATILYATHIYDGLGEWPTHVAHMAFGSIAHLRSLTPGGFPELEAVLPASGSAGTSFNANSPLLLAVTGWLRADLASRRARGQQYDPGHDERGHVGEKKFGVVERSPQESYNYWAGRD
ncbi:P-loop containing nucleoside triphosphate hydrolase protein [Gonapodya prolifera JEL478]|uniref:p-loop containing nucleoside triphosphate hydrolase protein n=1 Tax=Gonapodya prolifera (strain JEL478) TaxID=1344416 RepID=A0A139AR16_GONPJ|nr:P-loop containing nucleoside triphosphate hydrolase protein [Gonapodya prolifera JEL478]|eukprot:KXS19176.1 P-loop containing nucleoside triphosphate hydrolase protein [Gonapodya prolifera JEL478]